MPRSKSSQRWLQEHFDDIYVKKAQAEGFRSRAIYKLREIDEKEHLIKPGMAIVDLGAAPGGWSQYITQKLKGKGIIIALDILAMEPLPGVRFIQGDFQEEEVLQQLMSFIPARSLDLVVSDMAPNMSGNTVVDIVKAMVLAELAFDFADNMLKPGGTLVMKVFHGTGFDELIKRARSKFQKVSVRKPAASRARSRETYMLAKDYVI